MCIYSSNAHVFVAELQMGRLECHVSECRAIHGVSSSASFVTWSELVVYNRRAAIDCLLTAFYLQDNKYSEAGRWGEIIILVGSDIG